MRRWLQKIMLCRTVLVAALGLAGSTAFAQAPAMLPPSSPNCAPPPVCPFPVSPPGVTQGQQPGQMNPIDTGANAGANAGANTDMASLPERGGGGGIGSSAEFNGGYIDPATPLTQFRIRYDSMYDDNRPDRADFFYPKCGCFATLPPGNPLRDPNAKGPPLPEKSVDSHELMFYGEYAMSERFSGFAEVPLRWLDPEVNQHTSGLSDVNFGFKYALLFSPEQILTFQLRATAPSGDTFQGLGTGNWWLEPALLLQRQLSEKVTLVGELRDSIPVAPIDDFAGNVLRYGIGFSYLAYCGQRVRVIPIIETVGWTVLSGKEFSPDLPTLVKSASGDTIVNAKFGLRFNFGDTSCGGSFLSHSDFYVGYGRALTGDVWYKDIVRVEYRVRF